MEDLKKKLLDLENKLENNSISFENNESTIGNFLFHIFYAIYLTSFNIHISIFFLERASLLFFEFISLSIQEKDYQVECHSYINDAIIFTYKKTIGNVTLENIIEENKSNTNLQNNQNYHKILSVRNSSYLFIKILNKFLLVPEVDNFKKNYKHINEMLVKIYLQIDIDKYLFSIVSGLLDKHEMSISTILIRILLDTILHLIDLDFFKFKKTEEELTDLVNNLDVFFQKFISKTDLHILSQETELKKNNLYLIFKEDILRYISTIN